MADMPIELEQSRLLNLIRGFGWEMTEQKLIGNELIITVSKRVKVEPQPEPS
jgi:hypothetical protein